MKEDLSHSATSRSMSDRIVVNIVHTCSVRIVELPRVMIVNLINTTIGKIRKSSHQSYHHRNIIEGDRLTGIPMHE